METEKKPGKILAYVLGGLVYAGVVILATVLTLNFVTGILPADAYFMRFILSVGVVFTGLNSVALPVALHFWAVTGTHRGAAIALYALDMVILAFNMMTSFSTLMGTPPDWVKSYEPYSVSMFIFALATWGILLILDPGERASISLERSKQNYKLKVIAQVTAFLDSPQGQDAIMDEARRLIPQILEDAKVSRPAPKNWGTLPPMPVLPESTGILHSDTGTIKNPTPRQTPKE